MKKVIALVIAIVFMSASVVYAAKTKQADPAKAECVKMAKQEGIAKSKIKDYVKSCVEEKKAAQ